MATNADSRPEGTDQVKSTLRPYFEPVFKELGLFNVYTTPRDVKILYVQRFVRLFAYGGSTLILASYLSSLGISDSRIGLFMTLTLAGDVVISFFLTLFADAMGRKAILGLGALLMTGSGVIFALSGNYWVLLVAAIFGVISPSGNEIGPFRAVEESSIAQLCKKASLADVFAWYALIGSAGTAFGMIACGWLFSVLQHSQNLDYVQACRALFYLYAGMGFTKFLLTLLLSKEVERAKPELSTQVDPARQPLLQGENAQPRQDKPRKPGVFSLDAHAKRLMVQLCLLFALDSFASGLAPLSWVTYFFKRKFGLSEGRLGSIFFVTSLVQAASTLCAASIARRIGNVKTMVFTHLPSAVCLAMIPIPTSLWLALVFLVGRACTQSMDVAPRSAFLASALPPDQRTAMMGLINVAKTGATSIGPYVTGSLADRGLFWVSFVAAGILKATYDIGILLTFATRDGSAPKKVARDEGEAEGDDGLPKTTAPNGHGSSRDVSA